MTLIVSTSFGFAQNTIHDFQNTLLNSWWRCLTTNATKIKVHPALTESTYTAELCHTYQLHVYHIDLVKFFTSRQYSKIRPFADNKLNSAQMIRIISEKLKTFWDKRENAAYQYFLRFP